MNRWGIVLLTFLGLMLASVLLPGVLAQQCPSGPNIPPCVVSDSCTPTCNSPCTYYTCDLSLTTGITQIPTTIYDNSLCTGTGQPVCTLSFTDPSINEQFTLPTPSLGVFTCNPHTVPGISCSGSCTNSSGCTDGTNTCSGGSCVCTGGSGLDACGYCGTTVPSCSGSCINSSGCSGGALTCSGDSCVCTGGPSLDGCGNCPGSDNCPAACPKILNCGYYCCSNQCVFGHICPHLQNCQLNDDNSYSCQYI
jgi:hypothetical protein